MHPSEYQDIGQYLKESRESLRISLPQAAHDLHIRVKYLESLEAGLLTDMPGKAYIRGYIRNYAYYLRLNVDEVLEAYAFLLGPKSPDMFLPSQTIEQHMPTRTLVWLSMAALILLYAVWYFNVHDQTGIGRTVSALPAQLKQMLYNTPSLQLSQPWKDCLVSGDEVCGITLRQETLQPFYVISYPLGLLDAPYTPPLPAPAVVKLPMAAEPDEPSASPQQDDAPMQE